MTDKSLVLNYEEKRNNSMKKVLKTDIIPLTVFKLNKRNAIIGFFKKKYLWEYGQVQNVNDVLMKAARKLLHIFVRINVTTKYKLNENCIVSRRNRHK